MDPLAARLMSRIGVGAAGRPPAHSTPMIKAGIGLDPSNPLLPPVHNLRMIYLKEPLTKAEKDLHAARVALKTLETDNTPDKRKILYKAMAKLQGRESQYFATRYIGRDKPVVLKGWNTHFSDKVQELLEEAHQIASTHAGDAQLVDPTEVGFEIADMVKQTDDARLDPKLRHLPRKDYEKAIGFIKIRLTYINAVDISSFTPAQKDVMESIKKIADPCYKLAELLVDNVREVPHDLM